MRIILKVDIPLTQTRTPLSLSENQDVHKQIDEWLEKGLWLIRKASPSIKKKKMVPLGCVWGYRKNEPGKFVKGVSIRDRGCRKLHGKCTQR
ncbi:hypothetical protein TNIN_169431 [Trichonephila inaurata madagascariensis]|uniref:Uncharacterized protein n=1 Tax=Trichonephila inaurata madagascariensis TaxID=2747483 RepID=A0A8X6YX38_9ARAC|nr:hypothetical protein TNIN_169431 [Trichonephila inaurata madagascariensis]